MTPEERKELDLLLQLHLDEALDDPQAERLRGLLRDPEALDELIRAADLHAALAERRPVVRTARRAYVRRSFRRAWIAAAAVLAVAVLLAVAASRPAPRRPALVPPVAEVDAPPSEPPPPPPLPPPVPERKILPETSIPPPPRPEPPAPVPAPPAPLPPPPTPAPAPRPPETRAAVAQLLEIRGAVWIVDAPVHGPRPLSSGEELRTGDAPARAVVLLPDGTRLEVEPRSRLRVPGPARPGEKRVLLDEGAVAVQAAPQRGEDALLVSTAQAEVRVTGTRFTLWAAAGLTRLDVQEGRVRVRRPQGPATLDLVPGQFAVVGDGLPFAKKNGAGLKADYFESRGDRVFLERRFSRTDSEIDFTWGGQAPLPVLRHPGYAVRWTGTLYPRVSGEHRFHLLSECGARLWVGDRLLLDHWADHDAAEVAAALPLDGGKPLPIRVEYYVCDGQSPSNSRIRLAWSSPGQLPSTIPAWHLSPGGN